LEVYSQIYPAEFISGHIRVR